jgi:peptide/nickel transport system substrate-binding protein
MPLSRRHFVAGSAAWPAALALPTAAWAATPAAAGPQRGGTLVLAPGNEPPLLTSALTTAGPTQNVSTKIFDGLVAYDTNLQPQPQLATRWEVAKDGLSITFHLRAGVRWHDGKPFTSDDVAYSVLEAWKKYHSRGRSTFANVERVDTPNPLTAVLRLSRPAPFILSALSTAESQVLPKHLYAGTDPLSNPRNNAPIGTGPFRFVRWTRGSELLLERNPDYWDKGKPYLDALHFRFITDASAASAALETGSIHLATNSNLPASYLGTLARKPGLQLHPRASLFSAGIAGIEFNLDRPAFKDVRVRQAIAHAVDRAFLLKNVWFGHGSVAESPIPKNFPDFYTEDVPRYAYDLKKAEALLEQAGLKRDSRGVRLAFTLDPNPTSSTLPQTAQVLKSALAKIGVRVDVRAQDFSEFVNRVYTRRDFDASIYSASAGPDPAIGTQRFYWSKNFKPGVAFSNGANYSNPEVDRLLEAAQVEIDLPKRRKLYERFQQIVQTDLPKIPLISPDTVVVASARARNLVVTADGILGNFADAWLAKA